MSTVNYDWTLASWGGVFADYTYPNGAAMGSPQRIYTATGTAFALQFKGTAGTVLVTMGTGPAITVSIDGGGFVDITGSTFNSVISLPFASSLSDAWHTAVFKCTYASALHLFRRADAFSITGSAPALQPYPIALQSIAYDHRSTFYQHSDGTVAAVTAGQPVKYVTNAANPGTFDLSTTSGGYTLGVDGSGNKFLVADGTQTAPLEVASSGPLDALFTNGWTLFWAGTATTTANTVVASKGLSASGAYPFCLLGVNAVRGAAQWGSSGSILGRPFAANTYTSLAQTDEVGSASHYRDGITLYQDGAAAAKAKDVAGTFPAGQASNPLCVGGMLGTDPDAYANPFVGQIKALAVRAGISYPNNTGAGTAAAPWSQGHHETIALDRWYRNVFAGPEVLTNQPAAVVVDSNSMAVENLGSGPGPFDAAAVDAGIAVSACFMLGQASRSTPDILLDYPIWVHPLVVYLQSLGMKVGYHLWEGINDGYVEADNVSVMTVAAADTSYLSISTALPRDPGITPAATINAYNTALVADGSSDGWSVGRLDLEPHIGMAAFVANGNVLPPAYYADGTHWNYAGQGYGAPVIGTAIAASLFAAASTPTFSPIAGTYTTTQTVTIATSSGGASIRYTTDGSTPTDSTGTVYSTPVSVAATETVKALAYGGGYSDSAVGSALYTINVPIHVGPCGPGLVRMVM